MRVSPTPRGWKRWFRVTVRKVGGADDLCWTAQLMLVTDTLPLRTTFRTSEEDARKEMEHYARRLAKTVRACIAIDAVASVRTPAQMDP